MDSIANLILGEPRVQATGHVGAAFAVAHFEAAHRLAEAAHQVEWAPDNTEWGPAFERVRVLASSAMIMAAASLEALANELFLYPEGALRAALGSTFDERFFGTGCKGDPRGIERLQPLAKYRAALDVLGKPKFVRGDAACQNAELLVSLRNELMHFKPRLPNMSGRPAYVARAEKLALGLRGRFATYRFADARTDFLGVQCMSAGAAGWAVGSVRAFVLEFEDLSGLQDKRIRKIAGIR